MRSRLFAVLLLCGPSAAVGDGRGPPAAGSDDRFLPLPRGAADGIRPPGLGACAMPAAPGPVDVLDPQLPPEARPWYLSADQGRLVPGGGAELEGDVALARGDRRVRADTLVWDETTGRITLTGSVELREPGVGLAASRAVLDEASGDVTLDDARYRYYRSGHHGRATHADRGGDGSLSVRRGDLSRCPPGGGWRLSGRRIEVPPDASHATLRDATLRLEGVPVFYTPWARVPISTERQTGFLFPSFGQTNQDGYDLRLPFYWNIAPNADLTVAPRVLTERGTGIEGEARWLRRRGRTEATLAWLGSDDLFDGTRAREEFDRLQAQGRLPADAEFRPADRWFASLDHESRPSEAVRLFADWSDVSDTEYFRDLGNTLERTSEIRLTQTAGVDWEAGDVSARLWVQNFELLDQVFRPSYARLPELRVSWAPGRDRPVGRAFAPQWTLEGSATRFDREDLGLGGILAVVGDRVHLAPRLVLPYRRPWGGLTAEGSLQATAYDLDDVPGGVDPRPSRVLPDFSLDGELVFERDFVGGALMTLEPRLFWLWRPAAPQQDLPLFDSAPFTFGVPALTRRNRFTGLDRLGDANQLSTLLTSRWIDPRGRERVRVSVGRIHYFEDREVTFRGPPRSDETRPDSEIAAGISWRPRDGLSIDLNFVYDDRDARTDIAGFRLRYSDPSGKRVFSLDHRRLNELLDQSSIGVVWPLAFGFSFVGQYQHDWLRERSLQHLVGIGYETCCWFVRVLAQRFVGNPLTNVELEPQRGVYVQLVLKGLGGSGSRVADLLARTIPGFRPYEEPDVF